MQEKIPHKVKISQIVESQIPEYFLENNPNFEEFLRQYYISQEYQGSPIDILENINFYTNIEAFTHTNLTESTTLAADVTFYDTTISVTSTAGWPKTYGLLKINDEIITYTGITSTSFVGCIRGFCGVDSLNEVNNPDEFVFLDTVSSDHNQGDVVENLSNLFLKKFFEDFRYQYTPGFENVGINTEINVSNLTQYAKDFYKSKGTDSSFRILFDILFGVDISITKPATQLFTPSDGQWVENRFLIVEDLTGDIRKISKGITLKQNPKNGNNGAEGIVYFFTDVPRSINGKFYSRLGFDLETLSGTFTNTAVTKAVLESPVNSTSITVDSTVGFSDSGKLYIKTSKGLESFTYSSKTTNQFIGCIGLGSTTSLGESLKYGEEIYDDNLLYGTIEDKTKYFAVSNIVSDIKNPNTRYLSPEDKINIKSFGYINSVDPIFTTWIYNIANKYEVTSYNILSSNQCEFILGNYINLYKKDQVIVNVQTPGTTEIETIEGSVTSISNGVIVNLDTSELSGISTSNIFLRKKVKKASSSIYSGVDAYVTEVQNTYFDGNDVYVASSCLTDSPIETQDNSKIFQKTDIDSTTFTIYLPNHNYFSGELVTYETLGNVDIDNLENKRKYFIKKIDGDRISLCLNRSAVYKNSVIEITYSSSTSTLHKLTPSTLYGKNLTSQNLLKKFPVVPQPVIIQNEVPGVNGSIGLFLNGVEALDSKSPYNIYYGNIEEIEIKKSSNDINVIDPPVLVIEDENGSGIDAHLNISGSIKEVLIDNRGFRFLEDPKAKIIGGNGNGALLDARTTLYDQEYFLEFFATSVGINTTSDIISFEQKHNLVLGDSVLYSSNSQTSPGVLRSVGVGSTSVGIGTTLAENSQYFVGVVSERSIKLHYTNNDAVLGINTVDFTSHGSGIQKLVLNEPISVLADVRVVDPGSNYRNKKIKIDSNKYPPNDYLETSTIRTGVNTHEHYIFAKKHNFETGDLIEYSQIGSGTSIAGISSSVQYYVLKIDDDRFRLTESKISVATTSYSDGVGVTTSFVTLDTTQFLDQEKYIRISTVGVGTHIFKYPDIIAEISGMTAAGSTTLYQRVKCFGKAESIFIYDGGSLYGSEDIFNYEKQPNVWINSGSGAKINPILNDEGRLVDYVIKKGGSNYVGTPEVIVSGIGSGAVLKPTLQNGVITSLQIVDSGIGYSRGNTTITVVPVGAASSIAVSFRTKIKSWNVNSFELNKKQLTSSDDGVVLESPNQNYGNRYVNYTVSRDLREKLGDNIEKTDNGYLEAEAPIHSPILGWAYDGNPIYGPYGYSSSNSAFEVKRMESGYALVSRQNRPSTSAFPLGFFNDDYEFVNSGDLDECNGKFGITPEFPKGTYAYFCPISSLNGSGAYENSREPVYPYIIGSKFKNFVDTSNFKNSWDQNLLESKDTNLTKNLTPYDSNNYEFLDLTTSPKEEIFNIKSIVVSGNKVDAIKVITPGTNYKVNEFIKFDDINSGGSGCEAYVSSIVGKSITSVVGVNTFFYNVKFDYKGTTVTGITSVPHNLSTGDVIRINSVRSDDEIPENDTTDSAYFKQIIGSHYVSVPKITSGISTNVTSYSGVTGLTTFIELTAVNLGKSFKVNDVVGIKSESMLVLNIDESNNRLRVLRGYDPNNPDSPASSGIAFTTGDILEVKQTEFSFDLPTILFNKTILNKRSLFFDPGDSVGLGTTGIYVNYSVGIGSTSNQRRRFLKEQRIYLPNHGLATGDKLLYNPGAGIAVSVSNSINLNGVVSLASTVFVIEKGIDHIGLSTTRVGLAATGAGLYFVTAGSGRKHEFTTNFGESLIGDIQRTYATVSLGETHGLTENDEVTLNVIPNETITKIVKFDSINQNLIVGINTISSSGITTGSSGSSFTIVNHGLSNGSKIVYQSNSPALPLVNNREYYVIKVDEDKIRLSDTLFGSTNSYEFIGLTTTGSGIHTMSYINPKIDVVKGNILKFDVSDPSLSNYEFKFYKDKDFKNEFVGTGTYFEGFQFETTSFNSPGTSEAYVTLDTSVIEKGLYYSITLKDKTISPDVADFYPDTEVSNYSKIVLSNSKFNLTGLAFDTNVASSQFKIAILPQNNFETVSYSSTNTSLLNYTTSSETAIGPIDKIDVSFGGVGYLRLPTIDSIGTEYGSGAQLSVESNKIGAINRYEVYKPTFEIPSDYTVKPILEFPISLQIKDNYRLDSIGIETGGRGYYDPPTLIALNKNKEEISGLVFETKLTAQSVSEVTIIQNRNDLSRDISIIPIDNGNGFIVELAEFNSGTDTATLTLDLNLTSEQIANQIKVGDEIFVEGIESSSGIATYNSSLNDYKNFSVVGVNSAAKTVSYLITGTDPGDFNEDKSNGFVILKNDLARFTPNYVLGDFTNGEIITITKPNGQKEDFICTSDNGWDGKVLKVRYLNQFSEFVIESGDSVFGNLSLQRGIIDIINTSTADAVVNSSYVNSIGWEKDYGKLSVSNQKLSDNVYYQKMSYDIKTSLSPTEWKSTVDSLNHTSGFKSFGSVIIVSEPKV
ncbi:baseplate wedge initiator [Synechococcus phage DSL-LC02]|nr:baseplate wedge initiator [Synechococcus phage DSL-LC02]